MFDLSKHRISDKIEKGWLFLQKDILAIIWLLFEKIMRLGGHLVGNLENI